MQGGRFPFTPGGKTGLAYQVTCPATHWEHKSAVTRVHRHDFQNLSRQPQPCTTYHSFSLGGFLSLLPPKSLPHHHQPHRMPTFHPPPPNTLYVHVTNTKFFLPPRFNIPYGIIDYHVPDKLSNLAPVIAAQCARNGFSGCEFLSEATMKSKPLPQPHIPILFCSITSTSTMRQTQQPGACCIPAFSRQCDMAITPPPTNTLHSSVRRLMSKPSLASLLCSLAAPY